METRLREMEFVRSERAKMVSAGNRILELTEGRPVLDEDNPNQLRITKLILAVSEHLGNIGGLCDHRTQDQIARIQQTMMIYMVDSSTNYILKSVLPVIVGIQVDFSKRPFRAVKFELGATFKDLGAKLKAGAKR